MSVEEAQTTVNCSSSLSDILQYEYYCLYAVVFCFSLTAAAKKPMVRGLYDFDPESEGELGFREGDMIELLDKIDDNWYEGKLHGQVGHFPINYVDVVVPLP